MINLCNYLLLYSASVQLFVEFVRLADLFCLIFFCSLFFLAQCTLRQLLPEHILPFIYFSIILLSNNPFHNHKILLLYYFLVRLFEAMDITAANFWISSVADVSLLIAALISPDVFTSRSSVWICFLSRQALFLSVQPLYFCLKASLAAHFCSASLILLLPYS